MSRNKPVPLSHRLQYLAYRAFEGVLRCLSMETAFRAGELTGEIVHRFGSKFRKQVARNIHLAFGDELTAVQRKQLTAEVFSRVGANFFCSLKVPFLSKSEVRDLLEFEGLEQLLKSSEHTGAVLVSPHMGNWELLAQAIFIAERQIQAGTHYRPLNNTLVNDVVERRRKKHGLRLFAKHSSTHQITSFIREGGLLCVLADQRVGPRGAPCAFFGRPTTCSPLPHLLAKRSKGGLFSLVCETVAPARWKVDCKIRNFFCKIIN